MLLLMVDNQIILHKTCYGYAMLEINNVSYTNKEAALVHRKERNNGENKILVRLQFGRQIGFLKIA